MTLLYWRFTSGLYYNLVSVPEFANEFGDGFQTYVGDVNRILCGAFSFACDDGEGPRLVR
jgi:hypothetical protein